MCCPFFPDRLVLERRFDLELHSFGERADNDGAEGWSFGMKVTWRSAE